MDHLSSSRPDSDRELTGPARAAVVAALARMVVAELEREHLLRSAAAKSGTESAPSRRTDEAV